MQGIPHHFTYLSGLNGLSGRDITEGVPYPPFPYAAQRDPETPCSPSLARSLQWEELLEVVE